MMEQVTKPIDGQDGGQDTAESISRLSPITCDGPALMELN